MWFSNMKTMHCIWRGKTKKKVFSHKWMIFFTRYSFVISFLNDLTVAPTAASFITRLLARAIWKGFYAESHMPMAIKSSNSWDITKFIPVQFTMNSKNSVIILKSCLSYIETKQISHSQSSSYSKMLPEIKEDALINNKSN